MVLYVCKSLNNFQFPSNVFKFTSSKIGWNCYVLYQPIFKKFRTLYSWIEYNTIKNRQRGITNLVTWSASGEEYSMVEVPNPYLSWLLPECLGDYLYRGILKSSEYVIKCTYFDTYHNFITSKTNNLHILCSGFDTRREYQTGS